MTKNILYITFILCLLSACTHKKEQAENSNMTGIMKNAAQKQQGLDSSLNGNVLPVTESVLSSISTISASEKTRSNIITGNGTITFDPQHTADIISWCGGRIEKLYVKAPYQKIEKGQKLYELYSPELNTAQQELLYLLRTDAQNNTLVDAAKNKLIKYGLPENLVNKIIRSGKVMNPVPFYSTASGYVVTASVMQAPASTPQGMSTDNSMGSNNMSRNYPPITSASVNEGQYINTGQTLFRLSGSRSLWAVVKFASADYAFLKKGAQAKLVIEGKENDTITSSISSAQPVMGDNGTFTEVRIPVQNPEAFPGQWVTCFISARSGKSLWLNTSAILDFGKNKAVFVKENNNRMVIRFVATGRQNGNDVQIISGITPNDKVAADAHFLLENENNVTH